MNSEYWKKRAKALEYYLQLDAEKTRNEIIQLYNAAFENIDKEIIKIRRELKRLVGNISEEELNALLSKAQRDKSYEELLSLLELAESESEQTDIIQRIDAQAYGARITRAEAVKNKILAEFTKAAAQERSLCRELFASVFGESYYTNILNLAEGYDCGIEFDLLPRRAINAALNEPWSSKSFSDRIWQHRGVFAEQLEKTIISGLMSGKSNAEMTKELKDFTDEAYYVKERLIRTETAHFYGVGQKKAYEAAGIERYRFLAALSDRTCDRCAEVDNKVFYVDEATEGENYPPMHPNCRCTTITADASLKTRAAKDPETGESYKVDGNMSFAEWKESLSDEQKKAFEVNVRKYRNKASDEKQYERYIERLGMQNMPKTFDLFQNLKYNDIEKWEELKLAYKDKGLQENIKKNFNLTILDGKQGKHILGHNNYIEGRSYITISVEKAQELIYRYAGTGSIDRDAKGDWKNTETIISDQIIGIDIDNRTGQKTKTDTFKIHYAKKGVHIVPKRK